jgi:hypothetical protein
MTPHWTSSSSAKPICKAHGLGLKVFELALEKPTAALLDTMALAANEVLVAVVGADPKPLEIVFGLRRD